MKQYDFAPDSAMAPTVGLLHAMVVYNFERLKRLVQGLSQEEIDYRGQHGDMNSIAQLLKHLAVVDLYWVYRLQAVNMPQELQEAVGPMYDENGRLPMVTSTSLQALLDEYESVQAEVREVCLQFTDDDLAKVVPFENGNHATIRWGIWHIADHSRHHYANIAQLKKLARK